HSAYTHYNITKLEFLPAFKAAFYNLITKDNICASFRGTGLVPFNPEAVLSKLDVKLRTPSPPATDITQWESKTPSNAAELGAQSILIRNRIQRHQDSSPTSILMSLDQLARGAEVMIHSGVLLCDQVARLQQANEAVTKRRARKRKQIQKQGTLTKAEGSEIIAQKDIDVQLEGEIRQGRACVGRSTQQQRRCGRCSEVGHNARICHKDVETIKD
ncbi:hypothetical protein V491_00723, partial [Pseudogymnoascus sp. VKM F-3775]